MKASSLDFLVDAARELRSVLFEIVELETEIQKAKIELTIERIVTGTAAHAALDPLFEIRTDPRLEEKERERQACAEALVLAYEKHHILTMPIEVNPKIERLSYDDRLGVLRSKKAQARIEGRPWIEGRTRRR